MIYVWLQIDTGGPKPARVTREANFASNAAPMWAVALEGSEFKNLADMNGRLASDCEEALEWATDRMRVEPWVFEEINTGKDDIVNGARMFLACLWSDCVAHPNATVVVDQ